MKSIEFKEEHYGELSEWYAARHLAPPPLAVLPKNGRIVPGVGALFLYSTDSAICILEGAITNPGVYKEVRHQAIDVLTKDLLALGKELGFKFMVAHAAVPKIVEQAKALGFDALEEPYTCLGRNLWAE